MKFCQSSSSEIVCQELRKNLSQLVQDNFDELLRKAVSILTTGQDLHIKLPKKGKQILLLCCISWYFPETSRSLLQLELLEQKDRFGPDYEQKISLLLRSEPEMILYILESNVLGRTENAVFGKILAFQYKLGIKVTNSRKPKRKIRHRGYRDKGSLRHGSEYLTEERKDFTQTDLQNKLERQRQEVQDSIQLMIGFLQ